MLRIGIAIIILVSMFWPGHYANADGITRISKTNKFIKEAEEQFKAKAYKSAISAYENALKETPELPGQLHMNLGHAYYQIKSWEQAQKHYQTAAAKLNAPVLKSQSFQQIGNILFKQQDYAQALEWYKKSLKTNPANAEARFNYELAYKKAKEKEKQEPQKKNQEPQQDKQVGKDNKQNPEQKPENPDSQNQNPPSDDKNAQEDKPQNKPGKQKDKGGKSDSSDEQDAQEGEDQKDKNGKSEKADEQGKEQSEQKKQEAQAEDADAVRIDRKKLMESGLTVEQAKTLLNAMKQSEVKYLQQRRFKSPKGKKSSEGPRW